MEERTQPLVSMITYCYNGERFLEKYFQALLAQTYSNIELFFYNNGSADRTGEIAESYKPQLEEKGLQVHITHIAENQCTCELKNDALQRLQGKYFFGVDSDDVITPDHVEKMVAYLQTHPEKSLVFCKLWMFNEDMGKRTKLMQITPRKKPRALFVDCLMARNMIYTAISYMVRTERFEQVNHGRQIFVAKNGENYQILLPLLYHDEPGLLEDALGDYLVRGDSYSAMLHDPRIKVDAIDRQVTTIFETLSAMQIPDAAKYEQMAQRRLLRDAFYVSLHTKDNRYVKQRWQTVKDCGGAGLKQRLVYLRYRLRRS